jgi:hypothetical protein
MAMILKKFDKRNRKWQGQEEKEESSARREEEVGLASCLTEENNDGLMLTLSPEGKQRVEDNGELIKVNAGASIVVQWIISFTKNSYQFFSNNSIV